MNRINRSLVCKLKAGVFPIRIETGRYKGTKEELRICELCTKGEVEDEIHFIFKCKTLKSVRKPYLKNFYEENGGKRKYKDHCKALKCMLTPENIKRFGDFLLTMYHARRALVYR